MTAQHVNTTTYKTSSVVNCPIVDGICPINWFLKRRLVEGMSAATGNTRTFNAQSNECRQLPNARWKRSGYLVVLKTPACGSTKVNPDADEMREHAILKTHNQLSAVNCPIVDGIDPVKSILGNSLCVQ
jgi:hypothetical protein